jgi:uncharacterized protein
VLDDGRSTRELRRRRNVYLPMWSDAIALIIAVIAGGIASVTGFGIGSLLTPLLALQLETSLAVAAVSIPHVVGTAVRFWLLPVGADRRVLWNFGLTSAAGGFTGAALSRWASNQRLSVIFGVLLLFAAVSEMSGLAQRMRFRGWVAWMAGALSGLLGGLVGNQGGIRSAALLGFDLDKRQFVATATAIGLFVDGARMPIYVATQHEDLIQLWRWIAAATVGVTLGTVVGSRALTWIPEVWFRRVLAIVLAALGTAMVIRGFRS